MAIDKKDVIRKLLCLCLLLAASTAMPVWAAEGSDVVGNGLTPLLDIAKSFVSSVGVLVVLWGVFEWGNAMQSQDGMMQSMAFKRIGGGIVMTLAPQLLTLITATK